MDCSLFWSQPPQCFHDLQNVPQSGNHNMNRLEERTLGDALEADPQEESNLPMDLF